MKPSYLFLVLLAAVAALGAYHATIDAPAATLFVRYLGLAGFLLVSVSLMIGPAAVLWPKHFASFIEGRRSVGVAGFFFILAHILLVVMIYFGWDASKSFGSNELIVGMVSFWIVLALALTSTDWAVKMMGANWKRLQMLVYVSFVLMAYHSVVQTINWGLGSDKSMNLAQISVFAVAIIAVVMQICGFYVRRQRASAAKAQESEKMPAKPNVPSQPAQ